MISKVKMEDYRLITDNVHGHIKVTQTEFPMMANNGLVPESSMLRSSLSSKVSRLAEKIINTSVFKRLKSIKQLQAVHEVFPTGNHTRS